MTTKFLLYTTDNQQIKVDVLIENETVWLNQKQIAILFGKGRSTITEHINHIFKEGELDKKMVCRNFQHTTKHGAMVDKNQGSNRHR